MQYGDLKRYFPALHSGWGRPHLTDQTDPICRSRTLRGTPDRVIR